MISVEDLQVEVFAEPKPEDAVKPETWAQEAEEYQALGLVALAIRAHQRASAPAEVGQRLSRADLRVWVWRYPQRYYSVWPATGGLPSLGLVQHWRGWEALEWPVPARVRAIITASRPAFDRLEIWTPELRQIPRLGPSPILLGVRGTDYYLLARWAEALEPFEAIRAKMQSRHGYWAAKIRYSYQNREWRGGAIFLPSLGSVVLGGVTAGVADQTGQFLWPLLVPLVWLVPYLARNIWLALPSSVRWACQYAGWVLDDRS